MSRTGLIVLAVVTALVVAGVAWLSADRDREPEPPAGGPLVPGLADQVNDIEAVDIRAAEAGAHTRLRRERDRWRVLEKDGYEADFELVHDLLRDLAEGRRAEARTDNPAHFARLGVDGADESGGGVQVEFPGRDLAGLIVGNPDPTGRGRFVRLIGESRVWLSDRFLDIPALPVDWLERSVMDIPLEDIREIVIRHPDGDTVRLMGTGPELNEFVLANVPDGREAGPAGRRNAVARGLSGLRLEDVRRHAPPLPDGAVGVLFTTRDGLNFVASLFEDEAGRWAHFTVSAEIEASADDEPAEDPAETQLLIDAVAVDARLSPWEFRIRDRRFEDLTVRLEDLLAAPE